MRVHVEYFAVLREQAGRSDELLELQQATAASVYAELQRRHGFTLSSARLKVAINDCFGDWSTPLADGDRLVFIPPVAGG